MTSLKLDMTSAKTLFSNKVTFTDTGVRTSVWLEKWNWKSLGHVQLFVTPQLGRVQLFGIPWTIQSVEFSRPEYWSGLSCPSPGHLCNPGIEPRSPALQADSLPAEPQGKPYMSWGGGRVGRRGTQVNPKQEGWKFCSNLNVNAPFVNFTRKKRLCSGSLGKLAFLDLVHITMPPSLPELVLV